MSTIFTKIINKEIDSNIIYEDANVVAFTDINPVAPIHILIIPRKEIPTVNDIKESDKILIEDSEFFLNNNSSLFVLINNFFIFFKDQELNCFFINSLSFQKIGGLNFEITVSI